MCIKSVFTTLLLYSSAIYLNTYLIMKKSRLGSSTFQNTDFILIPPYQLGALMSLQDEDYGAQRG